MQIDSCAQRHREALAEIGLAGVSLRGVRAFSFTKGETLCNEGRPLDYLYRIVEGRGKICTVVHTGKSLLVNFAGPGDLLGDVELMTGTREATSTLQAVSHIHCVGIPLDGNSDALLAAAPFLREVGRHLAKKLTSSSKNSTVNILVPLEDRLCSYIQMTHEQGSFRENLTQVAELLGVSYRHLLRTLRLLLDRGVLRKEEDGYRVADFAVLRDRAREHYLYD